MGRHRPEADDRAERLASGAHVLVVTSIEDAVKLFYDKLHVAKACAEILRSRSAVVVRFLPGRFEVRAAASAADVKARWSPKAMKSYVDAINAAIDRTEQPTAPAADQQA